MTNPAARTARTARPARLDAASAPDHRVGRAEWTAQPEALGLAVKGQPMRESTLLADVPRVTRVEAAA